MKKKVIIFRVDSSVEVGTGHLVRCLTVADKMNKANTEIIFLCRESNYSFQDTITSRGYQLYLLPFRPFFNYKEDAQSTINVLKELEVDTCIVDHYQIDIRWEQMLKRYVKKMVVIDDLANREHDCDILIDHNFYMDYKARYNALVPKTCQTFLGPKYLILRDEFQQMKRSVRKRNGQVNHLLLFYGGSDPTNETEKALYALEQMSVPNIFIDVVVGKANPNRKILEKLCRRMNFNFHYQVNNMAELVYKSDLALGAGGVAMLERCYLGLPSLVTICADNQALGTADLEKYGAIWNLGYASEVDTSKMRESIERAIASEKEIMELSTRAMLLSDGSDEHFDNFLTRIV